jgi:hypothetical protein
MFENFDSAMTMHTVAGFVSYRAELIDSRR